MIDAIIFSVQKRALIKVLENIQAGVLNLTLPDGSKHRFKGPNAGPEADLFNHHTSRLKTHHDGWQDGFL